MKALVKVVLVAEQRELLEAWREIFADRPEVDIVRSALTERPCDAWVTATKKGDLEPVMRAALGEELEITLKGVIRTRYGGSLPADFAVCLPTGRTGQIGPSHLIAVSNTPRNPHGVNDHMRVALASAAALQAVHVQNTARPGSIGDIALPALGPSSVSPMHRAELMWTAYELFRQAELPDYPTTRRALADLLGDAAVKAERGVFKRTYRSRHTADSSKSTVPDRPSGRAPLNPDSDE